jgi:hypothetical protein
MPKSTKKLYTVFVEDDSFRARVKRLSIHASAHQGLPVSQGEVLLEAIEELEKKYPAPEKQG